LRQPYWTSRLGTPILYNSTQKDPACTSGNCWLLLDKAPNTACSLGVCDSTGTCTEILIGSDNSLSLSDLSLSNAQKWMKENIVGTVLIFSFVVWLPLGWLVHRSDLKQRKQNAAYGLRQGSTMTFRPKRENQMNRVPGARR